MDITKIYYLHYGDDVPFYIGKTVNPSGRMGDHRKKKGINVKMVVIDEVPTTEWKFWERYWISQFRVWGFILSNMNEGGGGLSRHSEETIDKIKSHRLLKNNKGKKYNYNYIFTEEHRDKIKQTRGHLKNRPNTWSIKQVCQYDLNGDFIREFESQKEATIFVEGKGDGVGACCRGNQKSAFGYIWKFKNI